LIFPISSCHGDTEAEAAGGAIVMPETQVMEGTVIGLFADPEGHVVGLLKAQPE